MFSTSRIDTKSLLTKWGGFQAMVAFGTALGQRSKCTWPTGIFAWSGNPQVLFLQHRCAKIENQYSKIHYFGGIFLKYLLDTLLVNILLNNIEQKLFNFNKSFIWYQAEGADPINKGLRRVQSIWLIYLKVNIVSYKL